MSISMRGQNEQESQAASNAQVAHRQDGFRYQMPAGLRDIVDAPAAWRRTPCARKSTGSVHQQLEQMRLDSSALDPRRSSYELLALDMYISSARRPPMAASSDASAISKRTTFRKEWQQPQDEQGPNEDSANALPETAARHEARI